jgi:hypothetical protein
MIVDKGHLREISNESLAYQPSFAQMRNVVARLAEMGLDLEGVQVVVYSKVNEKGVGFGDREYYRVAKLCSGLELVPRSK